MRECPARRRQRDRPLTGGRPEPTDLASTPVAPEPSMESSDEPPAARAHAREAALGEVPGGGHVGEFFAALGTGWMMMMASQRARPAPIVATALNYGGRRARWQGSRAPMS